MGSIRGFLAAPHRKLGIDGKGDLELLSSSATLGWERVAYYMVRGQVQDPIEVLSPSHLLTVNVAGCCDVEWTMGRNCRRRAVAAGAVSLFPALHQHSFRTDAAVDSLAWVIEPAELQRVAERELKRVPSYVALFERFSHEDPTLAKLGRAFLAAVLGSGGPEDQLRAEEIKAQVVHRVLRCHSSVASRFWAGEGCLAGRRFEHVVALMHELPSEELSLERLACEANLSPFYFLREFKRLTGHTPHQFLVRLRLEQARQLLAESDLSLAGVALRSGFSSQSHMTAILSRETGCTPSVLQAVLRA